MIHKQMKLGDITYILPLNHTMTSAIYCHLINIILILLIVEHAQYEVNTL